MTTVTDLLHEEEIHEQQDLVRGLKDRHVQLIAIGGAIGVGLFLGSATAISRAGPGLVLAYAVGGIAIFFIMRALGELLMYRPVAGSFASYAEEFVGPWAGFTTGWSYWFMWVVTGMAEITAVAVYVHYWFPDIPQWLPALVTLGVLYSVNLIAVKVFGELEFWFALIKVVTIIAMLVIGLVVILFGVGPLGDSELRQPGQPRRAVPDRDPGRGPGPADRDVRLSGRRAGRRDRGRGRGPGAHAAARGQQHRLADPDLLPRRPDRHHVGPAVDRVPAGVSPFVKVFEGSASPRRPASSTSS